MHNPVMYTDPNGEFIWAIPAAVFLVAGAANVAANWDNINGWEQGLTSFLVGGGTAAGITVSAMTGVGFGSMLAIAFGSGATTAATNNVISQTGKGFSGFSDVRWESVGLNSVIGGFSSMIGYAAGYGMANISNLTINGTNISSPILKGFVGGVLGGGTSGYISGFSADMMTTGNYKSAVKAGLSGMWKSAVMGAGLGILGGCSYAHKTGVNPWTGKVKISVQTNDKISPSTPVGRRGAEMKNRMKGSVNSPTEINGRTYTGHALDRLQGRGIVPSIVEDAINNPTKIYSGNTPNTIIYETLNVKVVVNQNGDVITVIPR